MNSTGNNITAIQISLYDEVDGTGLGYVRRRAVITGIEPQQYTTTAVKQFFFL
jgi:hypothetical protein